MAGSTATWAGMRVAGTSVTLPVTLLVTIAPNIALCYVMRYVTHNGGFEMTVPSETVIWAGPLMRRAVRDNLDEMKWRGYEFDVFEDGGWLERRFVIRGESSVIRKIRDWVSKNEYIA